MATLIFTAVGTLIGGPVGGALGALIGNQVDSAIIGNGNIQGSRLSDLSVTTSTYGAAIPRHFGQMRVAGSIIWATDLVEHSRTESSGKNSPSVTSYSYTVSFAVALASRPLQGIGRIWADGTLLRGAAGDLKVGGAMRFYPGDYNQAPDPLIAGVEGAACPGFRGVAYVVFEDLDLTNYGNRIPAMTFEVFADSGALTLAQLFEGWLDDVSADVPLTGITGFSCEGSFKDTLTKFQPVFPMSFDADGTSLVITANGQQATPVVLDEAAVATGDSSFDKLDGKTGITRKRAPRPQDPPEVLRYYDVELDYRPGLQRAPGQPSPGKPKTIELPASLTAANAFQRIAAAAGRDDWARETIAWRGAALDPAVVPGAIVTVPGEPGQWRVVHWELQASGVSLALERVAPAPFVSGIATSPGLALGAPDLVVGTSALVAYELPWDGTGSADATAIYAAVSSASAGWTGAALYSDDGSGALTPIGASGRQRSTIGTTTTALPAAAPTLFDRQSSVTVRLLASDMALTSASADAMVTGANRAVIGGEIIQFGVATPLGNGLWQLSLLLRGLGGSEAAIAGHGIGESFALLDANPVALTASLISPNPAAEIAALGLGDAHAAEASIIARGRSLRPLAPVHPTAMRPGDGSLVLGWVRRARGAWLWRDGVDVPLVEETEAYRVSYGALAGSTVASWQVTAPTLALPAATLTALSASVPGGVFTVQQVGTYALSDPLLLTKLG